MVPPTPSPPVTTRAPVDWDTLVVVPVTEAVGVETDVAVVFPAVKDPVIVLAELTCPAIPSPPDTVSAPEEVLVLAVVLVIVVSPLAERLVVLVFPAVSVPVRSVPDETCPMTPRPPETVKAPVDDVVLRVVEVMLVFPEAVSKVTVVDPATSVPDVETLPAVSCPAMPAPPETTIAPDDVLELAVALENVEIPDVFKVPVMVVFPAERTPVDVVPEVT